MMLENVCFSKDLNRYLEDYTSKAPVLLEQLREITHSETDLPQMLCGPIEGGLLNLFSMLLGAKRILEVGTFTGYSALSMASALPAEGELVTLEIDPHHAQIAQSFFDKSPHGHKVKIMMGPALDTMASLESGFDLAFIDGDKTEYLKYYQTIKPLMRSGGIMVFDNALLNCEVVDPSSESAKTVHAMNQAINEDEDVKNLLLSVRDGLMVVIKH